MIFRREWGDGNQNNGIVSMSMNSMTNSIDSTTILIPSFTQLPLEVAELGDDEMSSFIEHSFWQRGPMNVTSLKISSGNKVQPTLTVQVSHKRILAAQKRQVMQQLNSTQKVSPTKKNKKDFQTHPSISTSSFRDSVAYLSSNEEATRLLGVRGDQGNRSKY